MAAIRRARNLTDLGGSFEAQDGTSFWLSNTLFTLLCVFRIYEITILRVYTSR